MEQLILASKKDNQGTPVPLLILETELVGDNTTGVGVLGRLKSSDGTLGGYTIVEWDTRGTGTPQVTVTDVPSSEILVVASVSGTATASVDGGVKDISITAVENFTLNMTGGVDGQIVTIRVIQDATGSRTLTLGSMFAYGADITSVTLSTTAGLMDYIVVKKYAGTGKFHVVAVNSGFTA